MLDASKNQCDVTKLPSVGSEEFIHLKSALLNGDIEKSILWRYGDREVRFSDDEWPILDDKIAYQTHELSSEFVRQIKFVGLHLTLFSRTSLRLTTIKGYISALKTFAIKLNRYGITTFHGLEREQLSEIVAIEDWKISDSYMAAFNVLVRNLNSLPFQVAIDEVISHADIGARAADVKQAPVVPLRIYLYQIKSNTDFVDKVHNDISQLRAAVEELVENSQHLKHLILSSLRNGLQPLKSCIGQEGQSQIRNEGSRDAFIAALERSGLNLVDFGGDKSLATRVHLDIGRRVKELRKSSGLLQREVADLAGVLRDTVGEIERYNRSGPALKKVIQVLGEEYEGFALETIDSQWCQPSRTGPDRWMEIFEQVRPSLVINRRDNNQWNSLSITPRTIAGRSITTATELLEFMHEINARCIDTTLTFTGMRAHELAAIDPEFCIQHVEAGSDRRKIPVITTLTTKITEAGQAKNRVFVTIDTTHKAVRLLNAVHEPYRKHVKGNAPFFVSLEYLTHIRAPNRRTLSNYVSQRASRVHGYYDEDTISLRPEDIEMLRVSESGKVSRFKVGDVWRSTAHQRRRSLVYYLVGLELAGFQQLKEQLGHLSLHMTMYYGRNASAFSEVYEELEAERLDQQSALMANLFKRIANGERIAGGKAKSIIREMKSSGFRRSDIDRRMETGYWKEELELRKNVMRVHALAPGMYCLNMNCDARLEIDFSEVGDCDFSLIDSAAFIESTRLTAMGRLAWMEESGTVFSDYLAKELSKIRSAEKILSDLGVPYDRYELSPELNKHLIAVDAFEV